MAEKEYSTFAQLLNEGSIAKCYGSKYIFNCAPCPAIEKVRFSLIELGTQGKNHLDFFLPFERVNACPGMRELCEEIDSGKAEKRIIEDKKNQWPSAYQFVSGKDGSKKLNIGYGDKGIRVQIQQKDENGNWDRMMAVIGSYSILKNISFWYKAVMGIIPVYGYYANLVKGFWDNIDKYSRNIQQDASDAPYAGDADAPAEDKKEPAQANTSPDTKASNPTNAEKNDEPSIKVTFKTISPIGQVKSGDYGCWAINENGEKVAVKFPQSTVRLVSNWNEFLKSAQVEGKVISATFAKRDETYEFLKF